LEREKTSYSGITPLELFRIAESGAWSTRPDSYVAENKAFVTFEIAGHNDNTGAICRLAVLHHHNAAADHSVEEHVVEVETEFGVALIQWRAEAGGSQDEHNRNRRSAEKTFLVWGAAIGVPATKTMHARLNGVRENPFDL
jgi:hypothetical protein